MVNRHQYIKRCSYCLLLLVMVELSACSKDSEPAVKHPNIVFILADDLGYGDLASYGHPYAKTPNLDQLAQSGLSVKRCYAPAVFCSPSRAALITGRHPTAFQGLPSQLGLQGFPTVPELVKTVGYRTGHFGKWHIGDYVKNQSLPYGYDEVLNVAPNSDVNKIKDVAIFDAALEFMQQNKNAPFYVNIWTHATHFPIRPIQEYRDQFSKLDIDKSRFGQWMNQNKFSRLNQANIDVNQALGNYLAELAFLDAQVGRITSWLKENGLEENTIIVFTSDQGPATIDHELQPGQDSRADKLGYAGGLRGGKNDHYEGGVRIPFIISWPQRIQANQTDEVSIVSFLDWAPTIASILNIDREPYPTDGVDISEVLFGRKREESRELYWQAFGEQFPLAMINGHWKMIMTDADEVQLFDLLNDPFEANDLSATQSDTAAVLKEKLTKWGAENYQAVNKNPVAFLLYKIQKRGIELSEDQLEMIRLKGAELGFSEGYKYTKENQGETRIKFEELKEIVLHSILTKDQMVQWEAAG